MIRLLMVPVLVTSGLAIGIWFWTAVYHHRPTLRLLATLISTSALIVLLQLVLGAFGTLSSSMLRVTAVLVVILLFSLLRFRKRWIEVPPDRLRPPSRIGWVLLVMTAGVYGWLAWIGTLVPPYGWDAMTYHLTDILHFARDRSISVFPLIHGAGLQTHFFFPQVGELHSSWFYLLSGGGSESYRVTAHGLMPLALTAGVATRAIVERIGWRLALPWVVPGVMLTPIVTSQPLGLEVDVAFAAFLLSSLAFAVWAEKEGRFSHLAFSALAGGLAFGVKVSFLYFFLPVAAALLSVRTVRALTSGKWWATILRTIVLMVLFAAPCGYWFIRNAVNTGNPLWPTHVEVAGITFFEGPAEIPRGQQTTWYVDDRSDWLLYPLRESFRGEPHYSGNGFGPLFAVGYFAVLPLLIIAFVNGAWHVVRPLVAFPLLVAPFLLLSPTSEPRFVIALVGIGLVAVAGLLEVIGRGLRQPFREEESEPSEAFSDRLVLRVAQVGLGGAITFAALGSLITPAPQLDEVFASWRAGTWNPTDYYRMYYGTAGEAFNWLNAEGGPDVTFTFTNATFIAPVLGWHNRNRVVQAPISGESNVTGAPEVSTYEEWRDFLRREKVNYIVEWVPWWGESSDRTTQAWIAENPFDFSLVDDFGGRARIYRPVWDASITDMASEPFVLTQLESAEQWKLEYTSGVETTVAPALPEGVRFSYAFTTLQADYCDWRARAERIDWSAYSALSFDLTVRQDKSDISVYIKGPGGQESIMFRVALPEDLTEPRRIELPLRHPDRRTSGFSLSLVREIHFVFGDANNEQNSRGDVTVSGFRLEPLKGSSVSPRNVAALGGARRSQL